MVLFFNCLNYLFYANGWIIQRYYNREMWTVPNYQEQVDFITPFSSKAYTYTVGWLCVEGEMDGVWVFNSEKLSTGIYLRSGGYHSGIRSFDLVVEGY